MFPVRCYTCGKVLGNKYKLYEDNKTQKTLQEIIKLMGLDRYCCQRMIMGYNDSHE